MVQNMNKKGQVPDLFMIIVMITLFVITTITMVTFYNSITDSWSSNPAFDNQWADDVQTDAEQLNQNYDYLVLFILIGLTILTVVLGLNIRSHPVFFFISLLLLVIVVIVSAIFSDVYTQLVTTTPDIAATANTYTIIPFIMNHLPMLIFFLGVFIMILFYAKERFVEDIG